ncbi:MAG: FGGY-family carbohydrate kinase [Sphingobacteriales bacterium]
MNAIPVIAIFDVGKTNKKLFLFDENYKIVFEKSARFMETVDEDGFPCENLESLRQSVFDSLSEVSKLKEFQIKAVNFSAYGASFVHLDENGDPIAPLYNYLKPYPEEISKQLYSKYGGEENFSLQTASPLLGSLNSGLQLYRLKLEKPELFKKVKYALHLPQYLSFLLTGKHYSDMTSIGCHTALWDFDKNDYHGWVRKEGIAPKLAPITESDRALPVVLKNKNYNVGIGLHDSSAALIPYLVSFSEPFVLLSTGTWCISLNPFDNSPITVDELKMDCLCYLQYKGKPVKASRLFSGFEYDQQVKSIAEHFNQDAIKYRNINFDVKVVNSLRSDQAQEDTSTDLKSSKFQSRDLSLFKNDTEAYYQLMLDLIDMQVISTGLVLSNTRAKRIFVDGGFSKNSVYMHLLATAFPGIEIYSASMPQASALGAALCIHKEWNARPIPKDVIQLNYYSAGSDTHL